MRPGRTTLCLAVLLLVTAASASDVLVLKNRPALRGGVHRDDPSGVAFNPHHSRHPGMVFEVQTFPRNAVKEVVRKEPPFQEFIARGAKLSGAGPDEWVSLAEWCKEHKLKEERSLALLQALQRDPEHGVALKLFGRSKFPKAVRGDPYFDAGLRAVIEEYLGVEDPEERGKVHSRLKREHSYKVPREFLDRIIRSLGQPKGLTRDRALSLRTTENAGLYTLFVPKDYDPRRSWPLVVGLHGGGIGGKEGDAVVGNGRDAMHFYIRQAAARGYIVVCPSALTAPWAAKRNQPFLCSVIEEVQLLFNIDLNRVYLTGHSMGGIGTWFYGPTWAERFAAVSPMAGGWGSPRRLVETNTPVFIFHGADDRVVGPDTDRAAARELAQTDHDYVYTELDGVGHGFPESIQEDLFDFFDVRRLAEVRGRRSLPPSARVRSSFLAKVTRDEIRFLGDPLELGGGGGARNEVKELLKEIRLGGGKAESAADRIGELGAESAVKPLSDLLRHPATADDVRVQAARALGKIGHEDGYPGLAAGLRSESPDVFTACARAMASCASKKAGSALLASLSHLKRILEGKRIGGGNRIHISDWERWLAALAAAVQGVTKKKPEGGAEAIHSTAVKAAVCGDWDVIYSPRVGQDPRRARRLLGVAAAEALGAYGNDAARQALEEMKKARSDDAEIVAACEKALGG